jgi:hypothetical protein
LPSQIDISVVIVSYNCLESLKACLGSITAQEGITYEVIVVDNASDDGTREFLKCLKLNKTLLETNIGFGAGINLGASMAQGAFLFVLNPDTFLPPWTLKALYDFACENENAGLISPLIVWPNGAVQNSARSLPTRWDFLFGRGSPLFKLRITGERRAGYIEPTNDDPIVVPAVSATAAFIRAELFQSLGGFDSRFFMYLEDIDLCKRIGQRGMTIWLQPRVKVVHGWRQSSKTRPYFTSYHHHLSVLRYFRKHHPNQPIRNIMLAIVLSAGFLTSALLIAFGGGIKR